MRSKARLTCENWGRLSYDDWLAVRLSGRQVYRRNGSEIVNEAMVRGEVCVPPGGLPAGGPRSAGGGRGFY
jgi:allophanate hydrolase subunit 2